MVSVTSELEPDAASDDGPDELPHADASMIATANPNFMRRS